MSKEVECYRFKRQMGNASLLLYVSDETIVILVNKVISKCDSSKLVFIYFLFHSVFTGFHLCLDTSASAECHEVMLAESSRTTKIIASQKSAKWRSVQGFYSNLLQTGQCGHRPEVMRDCVQLPEHFFNLEPHAQSYVYVIRFHMKKEACWNITEFHNHLNDGGGQMLGNKSISQVDIVMRLEYGPDTIFLRADSLQSWGKRRGVNCKKRACGWWGWGTEMDVACSARDLTAEQSTDVEAFGSGVPILLKNIFMSVL